MKKLNIRRLIVKWTIIIVTVIFFSFLLIWSLRGIGYPGINVRATLVINGKEIPDKGVRIYETYDLLARIPFTTLLEELGYPVEWTSEKSATIMIHGEEYFYSSSEPLLCKPGEGKNYILPPPGLSVIPAGHDENQMYLDSRAILATMGNLGINIELTIDPENRLVIITGPIA